MIPRHIEARELPLQKRIRPIPHYPVLLKEWIKIFRHVSCRKHGGRGCLKKFVCLHSGSKLHLGPRQKVAISLEAYGGKYGVVVIRSEPPRSDMQISFAFRGVFNLILGDNLKSMIHEKPAHKFPAMRTRDPREKMLLTKKDPRLHVVRRAKRQKLKRDERAANHNRKLEFLRAESLAQPIRIIQSLQTIHILVIAVEIRRRDVPSGSNKKFFIADGLMVRKADLGFFRIHKQNLRVRQKINPLFLIVPFFSQEHAIALNFTPDVARKEHPGIETVRLSGKDRNRAVAVARTNRLCRAHASDTAANNEIGIGITHTRIIARRGIERNSPEIQKPFERVFVLRLPRAESSAAPGIPARIHLAEAIATIDVPARCWLKRHLRRIATLRTGNIEHLPILPSATPVV